MTQATSTLQAATDVAEFLADLDGGQFERKLSIALSAAAAAAVDNNKQAEVTLKPKLKTIGGSHMLHIEHTLDFKRPTEAGSTREDETRTTTLHAGKYGKLSLVPESQLSMLNKDGTPA